jgi:murein L,D-transpeptidase YcbB/YkuD
MRAVVGEKGKETPIFQSRVTQLVLNPWWSMPRGIAVTEALPELQRDPEQFTRNHVEVIDEIRGKRINPKKINWKKVSPRKFYYSFRQAPGPDNPLGTMKFTLPNPYAVYIHGTPEHWLFQSPSRTFSHGCVRLEKPMDLAVALMKDAPGGWTPEKVEGLIKTGKTRTIELPHPLPIYFGYWTAWVDEWDQLQFRRDVYGWDRVDVKSFAAAPDLPLPPPLLADGLNGLELDHGAAVDDGAGEEPPVLAE